VVKGDLYSEISTHGRLALYYCGRIGLILSLYLNYDFHIRIASVALLNNCCCQKAPIIS
jgi:hypothetical protein